MEGVARLQGASARVRCAAAITYGTFDVVGIIEMGFKDVWSERDLSASLGRGRVLAE